MHPLFRDNEKTAMHLGAVDIFSPVNLARVFGKPPLQMTLAGRFSHINQLPKNIQSINTCFRGRVRSRKGQQRTFLETLKEMLRNIQRVESVRRERIGRWSSFHYWFLALRLSCCSKVWDTLAPMTVASLHRNGVSNLPHAFSPRALENIPVRKHLQSRAFAHGKVSHRAIWIRQHVLSTGNAMIASFQRLGRIVEITARVPRIRSRAGLKLVVGNASRFRVSRVGQANKRVPDCAPTRCRQKTFGFLQLLQNVWRSFGTMRSRDMMLVPVCSIQPFGGIQ